MIYQVVGVGEVELTTLVLDLNGTLAVKGKVVEGVNKRLKKLRNLGFRIILFSGDQRGNARVLANQLNIEFQSAKNADEKERYIL